MNTEEQRVLNIKVKYEDAVYGIVRYKEKITELKAAEKTLKEEFKKGKVSYNEYVTQMAAAGEVVKEYKENIRGLSKEVQNNLKQEKEQEGSLRSLRAELSNCVKEYDSLSRAERESAKGRALADHINAISDELKEAEESTSRFYRSVGSYEDSIKNALGLNNKFADSLLNISKGGGGMSGVFTQAKASASAFGKTLMGLMTNPVFAALAGIVGAGAAFKWFYDYNKGIEEATRLTHEFLGLSGNELKGLRSEIQATADMFGKDYLEVLKSVDNLMSQYGISAQEALKAINDGFVAGADLSGNMLSQLQQYSATFHDAGIGASELVAILSQTRSGIFSDKGMDLIQTASKKIREMSTATASSLDAIGISSKQVEADLRSGAKSTFDIIQEISTKLKDLPQDSKEVGAVLKDVFGKQGAAGGLKMIESLSTMTKKIEDVKAITGEYGKEQERLLEANAELNKSVAALFDVSDKGFSEMLLGAKRFVVEGLTEVLKGVIKTVNYFIDLYNNSVLVRGGIEGIVISFKATWNAAKLLFGLIIDQIKGSARAFRELAGIIEGVLTFSPDKITKSFDGLMSAIGKTAKEMVTDFKDFGKSNANAFADGFNNTIKGKLDYISAPDGSGDRGNSPQSTVNYQGGELSGISPKNGSGSKTGGNSAAEMKKKELEEVRKAEDLMMQLLTQTAEQKRIAIQKGYDRQIEDLKNKLATEKNLTETAQKAINSQIESLESLKAKELAALSDDELRRKVDTEQKRIALILDTVQKGSQEEYDLKLQLLNNKEQLDIEQAKRDYQNEDERQQMILAILKNYQFQRETLEQDFHNQQLENIAEQIHKEYAVRIATESDEMEKLRLKIEEARAIRDEARQMEGESDQDWAIRKAELDDAVLAADSAYTEKDKELAKAREEFKAQELAANKNVVQGMVGIFDALGKSNKEFAKLSKVLALGEIAINTGTAIAKGVSQAQSVPYPANLVAIATTVATVLSNIATAISTVQSAKFAHGGDVTGPGTESSDSIPAMLSNGESVMTAQATRMFAPVLSAFNQIGGGLPITGGSSAQPIVIEKGNNVGLDILSEAVAKGMAMAPRPIVSVEEIRDVDKRLDVLEDISTI